MIEPIGRAAAAYAGQRATLVPGGMAADPSSAVTSAATGAASATETPPAAGAESSFGAFLDRQATQAIDTLKEGERVSLAAVAGKASAHEVVRAVMAAEMTVQTVVSIRDRMVQAYQDIMRMTV